MPVELSITVYLEMCRWHDDLPRHIQELAERFHIGTKWLPYGQEMPDGGWLIPQSLGPDGTITMLECAVDTGDPYALVPNVPPDILVRMYEH